MKMNSKTIIWVGWFLFLMCLWLPTSMNDHSTEPGWNLAAATIMVAMDYNDIVHRGWKYLYFAAPSLGNMLILLAPLVLLAKKQILPLILSVTMVLYGFLAASYGKRKLWDTQKNDPLPVHHALQALGGTGLAIATLLGDERLAQADQSL